MLFRELRVGPAVRTVELRHHGRSVFEVRLVDAVLIAVEREQAPVAAQAGGLERIEHGVRRETGVRPRAIGLHGCILRRT